MRRFATRKAGEVDMAVARYRACADIQYQVPNVSFVHQQLATVKTDSRRGSTNEYAWLKRVGCIHVNRA